MPDIRSWSTTAADNDDADIANGIDWTENQDPSTVNDSARAMMAAVRGMVEAFPWINLGHVPTRTGNTTFTIPGNVTSLYPAGRRLKLTDSATLYAGVVSAAYTSLTTITVSVDGGTNLSASLSAVALNVLDYLQPGTKSVDIASASTVDLATASGDYVTITGTTTITALGTVRDGVEVTTRFAGALVLTHNGTSLILLTGSNITTEAGDIARWRSLGSGNWRMVGYMRASGLSLSAPSNAYSIKTGNYTAVAGDKILADCTSSAWTLTLPASPANTDSPITVKKVGLYQLTVNLNSKNIRLADGTVSSTNPTIDGTPGSDFNFAFRGTDAGGQTNVWNY